MREREREREFEFTWGFVLVLPVNPFGVGSFKERINCPLKAGGRVKAVFMNIRIMVA